MPEGRERTEEEREAARLERERRRETRAGSPPPRVEPPRPPEVEPAPPPEAEPAAAPPPSLDGDQPLEAVGAPEIASGTRRVGWRERTRAAGERERRPAAPRLGGRRSRKVRVLAVLALVLAAALIWFLVELFQPFHGSGHGSVTVTIPAHSSSSKVGDLLESKGVIASGFFFNIRATLAGDRGKLRAGTYRLKYDMSYAAVLNVLTTPPPAAKTTGVTIVPGRTRSQISALLRSQGVRGSYLAATRHSRLLNPIAYGAPRKTPSLEGFLFPDTYQLRVPISISALVADQLTTFHKRFATVRMGYARSKHLTPYDVLIIASMVEAEAETARDRPLIASVIYNRLRAGMPLQIDATTRYATGNYAHPLTQSQLNSSSPYNTRIHKGLPPTPIDNPSLAAINAAANPARTNYLYFVVKPCGHGEHAFASNYNQFLAEVQRYYSARRARGGRSPANC